MHLIDLIHRMPSPHPWSEGDNIPWADPGFSERMLREHLTQDHDAASRRFDKIDRHIDWIHTQLLQRSPCRVLDLGCGPGLYSTRLARLGCTVIGIDFSPASIRYAVESAAKGDLNCHFIQEDIRQAAFGAGYNLVMLIYGEFNVFKPEDARTILHKAYQALLPGGQILLELSTIDGVRKIGAQGATWNSSSSGLFSEQPNIVLRENFWEESSSTSTVRYYCVDAMTAQVSAHASTYQAYSIEALSGLLRECGYSEMMYYPALTGVTDHEQPDFMAVVARKEGDYR